jgi:DNA mismatch repair protein MutS
MSFSASIFLATESKVAASVPRVASLLLLVLDRTTTAMGSRLLRDWLVRPLLDRGAIQARLDAVGELKDRIQQRVSLRTTLREVQDIARLSSRVTLGVAGPRELLALKESVSALPELRSQLQPFHASLLAGVRERFARERRWDVYPYGETGDELRQRGRR